MEPGIYTIFCLQFRTTEKSPWLKPKEKRERVERDEWGWCGRDYWGRSTNPHIGTGNDWRPRNKAMSDDAAATFRATDHFGWTKREYANTALKTARKDDDAGMYDSRDTYGHHEQSVRHEFRIVRLEITYNQIVLPVAENSDETAA